MAASFRQLLQRVPVGLSKNTTLQHRWFGLNAHPMDITGQDLACERGGRIVFDGLNFIARAGRMLVLRGPNGAGKTSLLRLVAGLNEPAAGHLSVSGDDMTLESTLAENTHFIAHHDAIKLHLTVRENLEFWSDFFGASDNISSAMRAMNLEALSSFHAQRLSAGQKRRLGLARLALIRKPVWLLDEPTVGLDTHSQGLLASMMSAHLASRGIIMASTHIDLPIKTTDVLDFASLQAA